MVEAATREKRELAMQEKIVLLRKREMVASAVMTGDEVRRICERHGIITDDAMSASSGRSSWRRCRPGGPTHRG